MCPNSVRTRLHLLDQVVPALDRPVTRHEHMHGDEEQVAGLARTQSVEADLLAGHRIQHRAEPDLRGLARRLVHEPVDRGPQQLPARVTTMLSPTMTATTGSRRCQPVSATSSSPTTTPTEVHTSVIRCLPSATSVMDRWRRPARMSTTATTPLSKVPAPSQAAPRRRSRSGSVFPRKPAAPQPR